MSFKDLDRVMMEGLKRAHEAYGDDWLLGEGAYAKTYTSTSGWAPIGISSRAGGVVTIGDEVLDCRPGFDPDFAGRRLPTFADAVERIVDAGRVQSESMRELQSQGYAWEQPERRFCACGQELREVLSKRRDSRCGDCRASVAKGETQLGEVVRPVSIDARIRDAREGRDEDPTTWTAGATPGWEWP